MKKAFDGDVEVMIVDFIFFSGNITLSSHVRQCIQNRMYTVLHEKKV
jgi:hypothetical protein